MWDIHGNNLKAIEIRYIMTCYPNYTNTMQFQALHNQKGKANKVVHEKALGEIVQLLLIRQFLGKMKQSVCHICSENIHNVSSLILSFNHYNKYISERMNNEKVFAQPSAPHVNMCTKPN